MKRWWGRAALALPLLLAALVGGACLVYPPQYVWRVLAWGDADADDWQRFPYRAIAPRPDAQPLPRRPDAAAVAAAWQAAGGKLPLEDDLAGLGTQAFVVLRDGAVLYEGYFNGTRADTWVTSFSVAKSILSVLFGSAVAEGRIASLDDPVTHYLPELRQRDARFERVRLIDLLRMAGGLHYEEFPFLNGDDAKTYYHPDLRRLALEESAVEGPPGERFHYNNFHPLLLGMVLERATGLPVSQYVQTRLWQPAGMVGAASWSLDHAGGFEKMESGFNARAEDFARFGQLMLQQGAIEGRQVVPAGWAHASTSPPPEPPGYYARLPWLQAEGRYYGAMWWGQRRADGGRDFAARGNHGQMVFVSPANGVVIVRHGTRYGIPAPQWFERARAMADRLGAGGRP